MDLLANIFGIGASAATGGGLGILSGVLGRGLLQLVTMWQQAQQRKHDLEVLKANNRHESEMFDKQMARDAAIADQKLAHLQAEAAGKIELEDVRAFVEAQIASRARSGIRWIDAANDFMRPWSFYLIVSMWATYKLAVLIALIFAGFTEATLAAPDGTVSFIKGAMVVASAIQGAWGVQDWAMLGTAWGFVYADRKFGKETEARLRAG